jgi:hypothetical protein
MRIDRTQRVTIVVATLVVVAIACYAGVLDGTHGKVKMTPDKATATRGEKGFDDTLSLVDGKFSSAFFRSKGFRSAPYNGEKEQNEAEFEVEQTSATNGLVNWLGEIRGKRLLGRLTWKKADGTSLSYDFDGKTD